MGEMQLLPLSVHVSPHIGCKIRVLLNLNVVDLNITKCTVILGRV